MNAIEIGTRVELLNSVDGVYENAIGGAQGVITAKKDDEGFPMVFIEWDKEHFRYTGEEDCWTFESHFKPIIEPEEQEVFHALESPEKFVDQVFERIKDEDSEVVDLFLKRLNEAIRLLAESDGFFVMTTKRDQHPNNPEEEIMIPYVLTATLNEETMILLEAQIVQLAAISHQEMAMGILNKLQEHQEDDE